MLKQVIVLFYLLFCLWPAAAAEKFAAQLINAHEKHQPIPHFSQISPQANQAEAYRVQHEYVTLRQANDSIAGYKAGLTSSAGQQKFQVSDALSGVLFANGLISDAQPIKLSEAGKLMLETEFGFILNTDISAPVSDIETLRTLIDSVAAVIELPDLGYEKSAPITGNDLIAANVSAHQFIMGDKLELKEIDNINQYTVALSYNGAQIYQGVATDALGDQWQALLWLVNQLVEQGYQLSAGEVLITGALGQMVAAQTGEYRADFAKLGQISFTIVP